MSNGLINMMLDNRFIGLCLHIIIINLFLKNNLERDRERDW